ncbi:ABC transporter ATP-binding protein [Lutispora sp.]|jgi:NitT/TauT family transport system ATP-binding protein|uniref:ABC transporter ATP-binding protein n=1 Tax=Lutispora sp. TaxID=2828727 RepID=UPI003566636B
MIQVRNLNYAYSSDVALSNINLDIKQNTTCAIIGPSGCGKTTLLYLLAGFIDYNEGEIYIKNEKVKGSRRETGVILQDYGLLPWKTVWNNIALGLKVRGTAKEQINKEVDEILRELDIQDLKNKYPAQLSGGQKQRVTIARTLVIKPDLLLLDEFTSALDAMTKENIQNLILSIYKKRPVTIVFVTHSIEEAVFLGQKIVIMEKARIKKIIDNPYFGDGEIRSRIDYYNICLEVRRWLEEGKTYENR